VKKVRLRGKHFGIVFRRLNRLIREVRALARLEHRNCVRYYSAWMEPTDTAPSTPRNRFGPASSASESGASEVDDTAASRQTATATGTHEVSDADDTEPTRSFEQSTGHDASSRGFSWDRTSTSLADASAARTEHSGDSNSDDEDESRMERASMLLSPDASPTSGDLSPEPRAVEITLFIQMEKCHEDNLETFIRNPSRIISHEANSSFVTDLVLGLQHVHSHGLCHRDLKPANCFFGMDGTVKLGDFGLAREFGGGESSPGVGTMANEVTRNVGTFAYAAPEQRAGGSCSDKADIFSLGLILLELYHPFTTGMERVEIFRNARMGVVPSSITSAFPLISLCISRCLAPDPCLRPSVEGILDLLQAQPESPTKQSVKMKRKLQTQMQLIQAMQAEIELLRAKCGQETEP